MPGAQFGLGDGRQVGRLRYPHRHHPVEPATADGRPARRPVPDPQPWTVARADDHLVPDGPAQQQRHQRPLARGVAGPVQLDDDRPVGQRREVDRAPAVQRRPGGTFDQ